MGIDYERYNDPDADFAIDPTAEYIMYFRDRSSRTMGLEKKRAPGPRDLEITDVQTTMVRGNYNWTFVRIYTDAGLVGTGEAFCGPGVPEIIRSMKPFLVGENPLDIDRLVNHLRQRLSGWGSDGGAVVTAISGIDIALHDLVGKVYDMPAYQLLGGKYRDRIRVYCDSHAGEHQTDAESIDPGDVYTPESYRTAAREIIEEGFDALKFDLDVPSGHEKDRANRLLRGPELEHKVEIIEAVTDEVGEEIDVAFDCHGVWSANGSLRLARAIEEFDVLWLEDPVPPENHEVLREVTKRTTTPIGVGEMYYLRDDLQPMIENQAMDVIHPDMPKFGGMHETRKAADLADDYYIPMALHNVSSPVATMAAAHVATSVPNFLALEYHARDVPWWDDLVGESIIDEGYIELPERPGLGVELDLDVVEAHIIEGDTLFDEA